MDEDEDVEDDRGDGDEEEGGDEFVVLGPRGDKEAKYPVRHAPLQKTPLLVSQAW